MKLFGSKFLWSSTFTDSVWCPPKERLGSNTVFKSEKALLGTSYLGPALLLNRLTEESSCQPAQLNKWYLAGISDYKELGSTPSPLSGSCLSGARRSSDCSCLMAPLRTKDEPFFPNRKLSEKRLRCAKKADYSVSRSQFAALLRYRFILAYEALSNPLPVRNASTFHRGRFDLEKQSTFHFSKML